jgi:predicted RNase H-like nuclease
MSAASSSTASQCAGSRRLTSSLVWAYRDIKVAIVPCSTDHSRSEGRRQFAHGSFKADLGHRLLGKRRSSVFTVPVRACLSAGSYEEASALHREADGRGLSRQAWGILAKIREVDAYLRDSKSSALRIFEVHPEVSFARWGNAPMAYRKAKPEGRAEREALIDQEWHSQREVLCGHPWGPGVRPDDLNDALAALWTARRIARGTAIEMPSSSVYDASGLPMRIVS